MDNRDTINLIMEKPSILWIDDDEVLVELVSEYLETEGFSITACFDGETGISEAIKRHYDLILLDLMLPTINGLQILKVLESCTKAPVIMLTASGVMKNEVQGLESGAIDYINKPCDLNVLVARINSALKRTKSKNIPKKEKLSFSNLEIDVLKREVYLSNNLIVLTNSEFEILKILTMFSEEIVSKKDLLQKALGKEWSVYDKNLDTHIKNLRKKLSKGANKQELRIKTVYGFGYLLEKND